MEITFQRLLSSGPGENYYPEGKGRGREGVQQTVCLV